MRWYTASYQFGEMPKLETERLILRKLCIQDANDIYSYSRDPNVARHVLWSAYTDVSEAKGYIRAMIRRYRMFDPSSWGIVEKSTGRVIGTIGYMNHNVEHRSAEVGYSLSRECWNKGYMTEALNKVIAYSFTRLNLHRIEAQHEVDNPASGRVMEKCGMQKEGILRGRLYNKGKFVDVALYSILKEDFLKK